MLFEKVKNPDFKQLLLCKVCDPSFLSLLQVISRYHPSDNLHNSKDHCNRTIELPLYLNKYTYNYTAHA